LFIFGKVALVITFLIGIMGLRMLTKGKPLNMANMGAMVKKYWPQFLLIFVVYSFKNLVDSLNWPIRNTLGLDFTPEVFAIEGKLVWYIQFHLNNIYLTNVLTYLYVIGFMFSAYISILIYAYMDNRKVASILSLNYLLVYLIATPFYLFTPVDVTSNFIPDVHPLAYNLNSQVHHFFIAVDPLDNCIPSLHIGLPLAILMVIYLHDPSNKPMKRLYWFFLCLNAFAILYLGIHWAVDIIAGILVALLSLWISHRIHNRFWQPIYAFQNKWSLKRLRRKTALKKIEDEADAMIREEAAEDNGKLRGLGIVRPRRSKKKPPAAKRYPGLLAIGLALLFLNVFVILFDTLDNDIPAITEYSQQMEPDVYDDVLVWTDMREGNLDIFTSKIGTDKITQLSTNSEDQWNPHIWDGKVVWTDLRGGNPDIYLYDTDALELTPLTLDPMAQTQPDMYGNYVVWTDFRHASPLPDNSDIYIMDITTMKETRITTDPHPDNNPSIYGDTVVWSRFIDGYWDLFSYRIDTGEKQRLTFGGADHLAPNVYTRKVVYEYARSAEDIDIHMMDIDKNRTRGICNHPAIQMEPQIYGKKIIWTDYRNTGGFGAEGTNIYMYDLSRNLEVKVSQNEAIQRDPAIYKDSVVWTDYRNHDEDQHLYGWYGDIYWNPLSVHYESYSWFLLIFSIILITGYVWYHKRNPPPGYGLVDIIKMELEQ